MIVNVVVKTSSRLPFKIWATWPVALFNRGKTTPQWPTSLPSVGTIRPSSISVQKISASVF